MKYFLNIFYSDGSLFALRFDERFDPGPMIERAAEDGMEYIRVPTYVRQDGTTGSRQYT